MQKEKANISAGENRRLWKNVVNQVRERVTLSCDFLLLVRNDIIQRERALDIAIFGVSITVLAVSARE